MSVLWNVETDGAHQRDRVAARHRPWFHDVIELDLSTLESVVEVHVDCARREIVRDPRQREIVSGDEADRLAVDERAEDARRADDAIVRVGAMKELIEEEQHRHGTRREIGDVADAGDSSVETRSSLLERVLDGAASPRCAAA